jgi:hypothetical protein
MATAFQFGNEPALPFEDLLASLNVLSAWAKCNCNMRRTMWLPSTRTTGAPQFGRQVRQRRASTFRPGCSPHRFHGGCRSSRSAAMSMREAMARASRARSV